MKEQVSLFWFRRDLRLEDNVGLCKALAAGVPVVPIFIFDKQILNQLEDKKDRRVDYIHQALKLLNSKMKDLGACLQTFYSTPMEVFEQLTNHYDVQGVYCNRDYEPKAIARDTQIYDFCKSKNIAFKAFKDQVVFDKNEIIKNDGTPYTVYTPYAKKWREKLTAQDLEPCLPDLTKFKQQAYTEVLSLSDIGFEATDLHLEEPVLDLSIISNYDKFRDFPAMQLTTQLGIALRFGTISIRKCASVALQHNATWLNELIWREFFMQILYHFPRVVHLSFKTKYDNIIWRNNEAEFTLWCEGKTGYPIVDAGMRQLNETGYMHNRVRMIVASFLCKHLLIDWRWGETYFAQKLNDYDLSANNGNWQWAAGCGCDAAPYFRVFNPTTQTEKFDKKLEYIKKWVPEYGKSTYPEPMVEHSLARERVLKAYKKALNDV